MTNGVLSYTVKKYYNVIQNDVVAWVSHKHVVIGL
jgi:hypothetical protein